VPADGRGPRRRGVLLTWDSSDSVPARRRRPRPAPAPAPADGLDTARRRGSWTPSARSSAWSARTHTTPRRRAAETRAEADAWRRRLAYEGPAAARDWEGAVRFAGTRRRAEHAHVEHALGELRDAVWVLVRGLHAVASEEAAADGAGDAALRRLADAVTRPDVEAVGEAARAAVAELGGLAARRVRRRETEIRQLGQQLEAMDAALVAARREGATDPLTGLGNRRAFDETVGCGRTPPRGCGGAPSRSSCSTSTGLKAVNDAYGPPGGRRGARGGAAQLARAFLRRGDALARHGGDEFAAVLPDTGAADAERLARRAVEGVAGAAPGLQERWRAVGAARHAAFGLSAGMAQLAAGESADAWVARADAALYAAKAAGKGMVVAAPG
jgi:diguanylate cyclase (GGDEF)-like protein